MILRMRRLPYRCEFSGRRGVDRESGRAGAEAGDGGGLIRVESCGAATGDGEWGRGPAFSGKKRVSLRSCTTTGLLPRSTANAAAAVGGCGFVLCGAARQSKAGRQGDHGVTDTDKPIAMPTQQGGRPSTRTAALQAGCCFEAKRAGLLGGFVWTQSEAYSVRRSKSIVKIRRYGVQVVI